MNILALDTCTECCSAALLYQNTLFECVEMTTRGHSDLILGMMDDLFKQAGCSIAEIEALAFGRGPGSFTGVRVGVGVAQGIAFARELPVLPISSLHALAQDAAENSDAEYIAVAIDARMGEIYCANYQCIDGLAVLLDEEQVCSPAAFLPLSNQQWLGAGTGWGTYEAVLSKNFTGQLHAVKVEHYPQARAIITLAKFDNGADKLLSAEQAIPVYLRNNVAKKKAEQ